jgi:hypothetical protein
VGAVEAGSGGMKFGLAAADATPSLPPNPTPTPTPVPTPPPAPTPPPTTGGSQPISSTIDSSSYTINAGQSVTFTVRVLGNSGTPTGTVNFLANGASISGCSAIAIANGTALCTTSSLAAGSIKIKGQYSGNGTYASGVAGPITQTVKGSTNLKLSIDSSAYTSSVGQSVTFTVTVSGAATGQVNFTANNSTVPGCGSVAVNSSGVAKCTTNSFAAGSYAIRGVYTGVANGVAGPITQTVR